MPFLAPIGAAIGAAIGGAATFLMGGSLLAKVAMAGLAIAAQWAIGRLFQKRPDQPQAQASQLETRYGENLVRQVVLGTVGTAGHHVYRNAYGKGNHIVQDVYVLSHFRITGVSRVRYDGVWRSLGGTENSERGFRIQGIDAEVWVKVYQGTMGQSADPGLVNRAKPSSRWTSNHRGAGMAYAVVTSVLTRDHLPNPWQAFFEVQGPPLYDWRLDDTAGGSGANRWNNAATWSGNRNNPILQMYALERGLFNGTEMMVGKGVSASNLPLSQWTLAANISDESVGGGRRYRSSCIVSSGDGVTHQNNMQPILDACAGSWIELVGQEYPLAGANQASVATITDDDLVVGQPFRFSAKRPRSELVNTVAGVYSAPNNFYSQTPMTTRIDTAARAADGERLAVSINWGAVTHAVVADRLGDIAIRASRFQASADIWVRPKFLGLRPGQWVTWESARYGTRKFQVLGKQLGPFGSNNCRNVSLNLQEVSEGIFDPTAYETLPPDAVWKGAPEFLFEVENFNAAGIVIVDPETDRQYAGIRLSWDIIDDPTVNGVDVQWRPKFQPTAVYDKQIPVDQTVVVISEGMVTNTVFEVRTRPRTKSGRPAAPWAQWVEVTTPDIALDLTVRLANLQKDVRDLLTGLVASREQFRELIEQLAMDTAIGQGKQVEQYSAVVRETNAVAASVLQLEAEVFDGESGLNALATAILGVEASVDDLAAGGRISFRAQVPPPSGVLAQIEVLARASDAAQFVETGMVIQVYQQGPNIRSRIVFLTDQFIVSDGTASHLPMVFEGGVLKLNDVKVNWADIENVSIGTAQIQNAAITTAKINNAAITSSWRGPLQVEAI